MSQLQIRPERPGDAGSVRRLVVSAFDGRTEEADVVERLRARAASYMGLVAVLDGGVVGQIAFSRVSMEPEARDLDARGLAPMAVDPRYQRCGIGSKLVREGLAACRADGCHAVFVLGHPTYYPRFGFTPAAALGIESEYRVAPETFMVVELQTGALNDVTGTAKYDPALAG